MTCFLLLLFFPLGQGVEGLVKNDSLQGQLGHLKLSKNDGVLDESSHELAARFQMRH